MQMRIITSIFDSTFLVAGQFINLKLINFNDFSAGWSLSRVMWPENS